jgi:PEP-CTERM motif
MKEHNAKPESVFSGEQRRVSAVQRQPMKERENAMNPMSTSPRLRPCRARLSIHAVIFALLAAAPLWPHDAGATAVFSVSGIASQNSGAGCAYFGLPSPITSGSGAQGTAQCADTRNSVAARASADGLGAFASVVQLGGSGVTSYAIARVDSQFMITGADGVVDASLNLVLSSTASGTPGTSIFIEAGLFGFGEVGQSPTNGALSQRNGGLWLPDVDCSDCAITSKTISLQTNTWLDFLLLLRVESIASNGQIDAMNTLSFPSTGFVFNLPEGYSATIDGMNVVDNRLVVTSAVPEPSSVALVSLGLLGLVRLRRRRPQTWQTSDDQQFDSSDPASDSSR